MVHNVGGNGIKSRSSIRYRPYYVVPKTASTASTAVQGLREGSIFSRFMAQNYSLPTSLCNLKDVDLLTFKKKLDEFLWTVADEPQSPGYTAGLRAVSNSLLHMIPSCRH